MSKPKLKPLSILGTFNRSSFDSETRTIEVICTTDAPVVRYGWDGNYNEVLSMDPAHVRMERFTSGAAPLLNAHNRSELGDVIGVIERAWLEGNKLMAVVRFSDRENVKDIVKDVADGILKSLSIGYKVLKIEETKAESGKLPTYKVIDWEPYEVSFVPVPADPNAVVRSNTSEENEIEFIPLSRGIENSSTNKKDSEIMTEEQIIAAQKAENEKIAKAQKDAQAIERSRAKEIRESVKTFHLGEEVAERLIEEGVSIEEARAQIQVEFAKKDPSKGASNHISVGKDGADKFREAAGDALLLRADPTAKLSDERIATAREFRGMSQLRLAEESLIRQGVKTSGMSPREIAQAALEGNRGAHTTSDFPILLGSTFNRTLRAAYQERERTFMPFSRRATMPDFREMSRAQLSGLVGSFDEVVEASEYKAGSLKEEKETYKLAKYGKTVHITWESIINDDLGAFNRLPQAFASAAVQKQSDIVYGILSANAVMADGHTLFKVANHKNTITPGTVINVDNLGIARKAIRNQTGPNGSVLNLIPRFLVVGSDNEQLALQFSSKNYVAAESGDINVWAGLLQPIVEPRILGNKWYLMCDPAQIDTIEYSFLDGEEELFTENKWDFSKDAYAMKARMVFAAKAIDHRGMFYNPGQ